MTRNHYTINKNNHLYVPEHSLGGGWTRQIVELGEGDTADNPASTKDPLYGSNPPCVVVYDRAPDGGVRAVIYDSAKDFYASLMNLPSKEAMQAVIDYCWNDEERDYECMKDAGEAVSGHVFEHLRVLAFWLAGNK